MDDITISTSSTLSINLQLIFDMHDLNGAIFLKISFLFFLLVLLVTLTLIYPVTTIYASL